MSFHVHTTKDPHTGTTEVITVDYGDTTMAFERKYGSIHVTAFLGGEREEMTLTPAEATAFAESILAMAKEQNLVK